MPVSREVVSHARSAPDRTALDLGRGRDEAVRATVTYGELARRVVGAAGRLGPDGPGGGCAAVDPGDIVAIVPEPRAASGGAPSVERWAQTLVALLAVDLVGGIPLVCDDSWDEAQRAEVLARVRPDRRVRVTELVAGPGASRDVPGPASDAAALSAPDLEHPMSEDRPGEHGVLAWAGFTSGSTGRPRAVVRTRRSWAASFGAVTALSRATTASVVLVPGPLATSLYCFGTVHALALGATVRPVTAPGDLPLAALRSDVLHVTPLQLDAVIDALDTLGARPHAAATDRARTALVGGADLSDASRRRAAHAGIRVVSYYGAAELSFVAVDADGTGLRPFPEVEIDVRVEGDDPHGSVWVRSPWLASGYLSGADGPLQRSGGWASVGDLAEPRTADGPLVLRGRGTGAITVGAATVLPEDVEAVLATDPGLGEVVVLGTPHPRWGQAVTAVVVLAGTATGDAGTDAHLLARLERLSRTALTPAQRPRRWLVAPDLPRTSAGKLARADVARQLGGYRRLSSEPQR